MSVAAMELSDCVCSAGFSALGDESSGLIQRQSRDGEIPFTGAHREMCQFFYPKVFVSIVVGTPFHSCKKKGKSGFNWACRFCVC